ncbi:hypothetical protein Y032_0103g3533 [Ancylostoma ceylanicum]|uniref:Uncharacterized protein n=1 Tax=Ancylostoma ceylanicum TaxID=53326 RepID=A0A016TGX6_9BILA|nr:hypothetical protein Y032_0103g3533 [Ancylostoma ceylanicum]
MVVAAVGSIYYPPFCYGFTNLFLAILLLILTVLVTVILGAVMSGAWMSLNVLGIFLAVHRMISLAYPLEEQRLFSGMKKTLSVWTRYQFTREKFMWEYDPSLPLSAVFQKIGISFLKR